MTYPRKQCLVWSAAALMSSLSLSSEASTAVGRTPAVSKKSNGAPSSSRPLQCGPEDPRQGDNAQGNEDFERSMKELFSKIGQTGFRNRIHLSSKAPNDLGIQDMTLHAYTFLKAPVKVSSAGFGPPKQATEPHAELGASDLFLNAFVSLKPINTKASQATGQIYFTKFNKGGVPPTYRNSKELNQARELQDFDIAVITKDSSHALIRIRSMSFKTQGGFFSKASSLPNAKKKPAPVVLTGTCSAQQESVRYSKDARNRLQAQSAWTATQCQYTLTFDPVCGRFDYDVSLNNLAQALPENPSDTVSESQISLAH